MRRISIWNIELPYWYSAKKNVIQYEEKKKKQKKKEKRQHSNMTHIQALICVSCIFILGAPIAISKLHTHLSVPNHSYRKLDSVFRSHRLLFQPSCFTLPFYKHQNVGIRMPNTRTVILNSFSRIFSTATTKPTTYSIKIRIFKLRSIFLLFSWKEKDST